MKAWPVSNKTPQPFPAEALELGPVARGTKEIEIDLDEFDLLQAEVCVLRDANAALARDRDRLLAERDELRAALRRLRR
jgi:hypothetical protein